METETTTATETVRTTADQPLIRFDSSYAKTLPGLIKLTELLLDLVGFICISVSKYNKENIGLCFKLVAMLGFWLTGTLLIQYLFLIVELFPNFPWFKIELVYCALWAVCYLLVASFAACYSENDAAYAVAAVFGICATVAYSYDAWLKFRAIKRGHVIRGKNKGYNHSTRVTFL